MSKRHKHGQTVLPPKVEIRAHAHNERHRVNSELHLVTNLVSHGVEPDDVTEPGRQWKPVHHHDAEIGIERSRKQSISHWKTKSWKRRSVARKQRAQELLQLRKTA
ncbi:MAG: hypothetical protein D4R44_06145 [Actinobacteria bacterium]|nr:MAG: hypothetical protein D4R44_06145 [Actinomycetota bacterium]